MSKLNILAATALSMMMLLTSCDKEAGALPDISLKSGTGYTASNATVGKNENIKIGIVASVSGANEQLKSIDATRIFDGGSSNSFYTESLSVGADNEYSKDFNIVTRDQAGTEKYTFTVINNDGLRNSVSVTLTVN